jgi:hypothetical protein
MALDPSSQPPRAGLLMRVSYSTTALSKAEPDTCGRSRGPACDQPESIDQAGLDGLLTAQCAYRGPFSDLYIDFNTRSTMQSERGSSCVRGMRSRGTHALAQGPEDPEVSEPATSDSVKAKAAKDRSPSRALTRRPSLGEPPLRAAMAGHRGRTSQNGEVLLAWAGWR